MGETTNERHPDQPEETATSGTPTLPVDAIPEGCRSECPWPQWGKHVLEELRRLNETVTELRGEFREEKDRNREWSEGQHRDAARDQRERCEERHTPLERRLDEVESETAGLKVSAAVTTTKIAWMCALATFASPGIYLIATHLLKGG